MKAYSSPLAIGLFVALSAVHSSLAQDAALKAAAPIAASAPTAVPSLVPFSGEVLAGEGNTPAARAGVTFLIYKDEAGGEALWAETQTVAVDPTGHFKAQLGATTPNGLPSDLFSTGEARWLEVQVAGQAPQSRVLLASVPYALKASDAATLGGLPASAFALAGTKTAAGAIAAPQGISPDAATTVTTTGGTVNNLAKFSGASTIVDSLIFDNGTDVGIGNSSPAATLDVRGTIYLRGNTSIYNLATATASAGSDSADLIFLSSVFDSAEGKAVKPLFEWQAEPTGNNTSAPGATLNLLSSNGIAAAAETGLSLNPNGTIKFAAGQTFPGTGAGTITGVTAGTDLTGGGTSGNVTLKVDTTKVPLLATANNFIGNQLTTGNVGATGGLYGSYAIVTGDLTTGSASLGEATAKSVTATESIEALGGVFSQNAFTALASPVASASGGGFSYLYQQASIYNSSTKTVITPTFAWEAGPLGNNTASPSAELALLYGTGNGASPTGLSISPKGLFTFAPGQTFPGTGTGNGTITGVTAGTDLTGGGASGNVTLNLNTADTDTRYARLASSNTFTGAETFNGFATFNDGFTANTASSIFAPSTGLDVYTTSDGSIFGQLDVPASSTQNGWAIEGVAYNAYSGVYGYGDNKSVAGVIGSGNIGVYATSDEAHASDGAHGVASTITAAVYAQAGEISGSGQNEALAAAALFADGGSASSPAGAGTAISASSDNSNTVIFTNNAPEFATVIVQNFGTGGLLLATGPAGSCDIDGNGDLTCSGTVSGSNLTAESHTIKTYGVQAAENWYEDAGSGQLRNGLARIALDSAFSETVNAAVEYHVFLTPNGDSNSLYVTNKTASGFEVHESGHGSSSIAFDYRIMAKRKGYEQVRLEDITETMKQQKERERIFPARSAANHVKLPTAPSRPPSRQPRPTAQLNPQLDPQLNQR